jgi:membrane protein
MPRIVKPASVSWAEIVKRTWKEIVEDDVFGRAAQLSYYFLLAIFPLLLCMMALLGTFSQSGEAIRQALLTSFGRVLPQAAFEIIEKTMNEVQQAEKGSKISIGLLLSLWSASAGMSAIMDTLNTAYEVTESRSFVRRTATAIGLTVVVAMLILAAVGVVLLSGWVAQGPLPIILNVLQWPAAMALMLLAFALIYYFAPDLEEQEWHWVTPGAIVGLILWLMASVSLKVYLHFFNTYSATYGSLGAVIILLLWFYLTGVSVLTGAEFNSEIENAAAQEGHPDAKLKGEKAPDDDDGHAAAQTA